MNVVDISSEDIRDVSNFALVNQKKLKNREVNLFSVFFFFWPGLPTFSFPSLSERGQGGGGEQNALRRRFTLY